MRVVFEYQEYPYCEDCIQIRIEDKENKRYLKHDILVNYILNSASSTILIKTVLNRLIKDFGEDEDILLNELKKLCEK